MRKEGYNKYIVLKVEEINPNTQHLGSICFVAQYTPSLHNQFDCVLNQFAQPKKVQIPIFL